MSEYTYLELKDLLERFGDLESQRVTESANIKRAIYMSGCNYQSFMNLVNLVPPVVKTFLEKDLKDMPLYINDEREWCKKLASWRLRINK